MTRPFKPYLPGVLALIAEEVGLDTAITLAKARGGRSVFVPKRPEHGHSLVEIVGFDAAIEISRLLGHGNVMIPCGNIKGAAGRRARIETLLREGWSPSAVQAEVDVSIRTVERVSASLRDDQPSLFLDLD